MGVLQLFSAEPRAAQFALASLQPADLDKPTCWACRQASLGDVALRTQARENDEFLLLLYSRLLSQDWHFPHAMHAKGRLLQAFGDLRGAERAYRSIADQGWPASVEAQQMLDQLEHNTTL